MNHKRFYQYGCWNNLICGKSGEQKNVVNAINRYTKKYPGEFLIITGDNYYPEKVSVQILDDTTGEKIEGEKEKIKLYDQEIMDAGFDCIGQINIPKKYLLLGNHDVEQLTFYKDASTVIPKKIKKSDFPRFKESLNKLADKCTIIENELRNSENLEFKKPLLADRIPLESETTIIIAIDTSIFEIKSKMNANSDSKLIECYQKIPELKQPQIKSIDDVYDYVCQRVLEIVKTEAQDKTNIIFAGHHPIITFKMKKNKVKLDGAYNLGYFLQEICNELPDTTNYYYLCADVHHYQKGDITISSPKYKPMRIQQYITGTGGADLDEKIPTPREDTDGDIHYVMHDSVKTNGFLECILINDNTLKFNFIDVKNKSLFKSNRRTSVARSVTPRRKSKTRTTARKLKDRRLRDQEILVSKSI